MNEWIRLVGPNRTVELFGLKLVGVNAEIARKVLFTLLLVGLVFALRWALGRMVNALLRPVERVRFWARQAVGLFLAVMVVVGSVSIWFDDPTRIATALGLFSAGLAVALQRVITALAGYIVILRGKTFGVGDRITMGGVRGDVIGLSFINTTIMEMGQPAATPTSGDPAVWVRSRQYTGRIVTVSNDKIFDEPVYNFTREFPFIWEELALPVPYSADRDLVESFMLGAARRHTVELNQLGEETLQELERRYVMQRTDLGPRVYFRLTDNWLEMTVRFIADTHGIRETKDAMAREILRELDRAGIHVASATHDIVGLPPLRLERT